jgi:hypothetical protein
MLVTNVKTLKDFLATVPDDTKIVVYRSSMETNGYMENVSVNIRKMIPVEKNTWDRFDGTDYTYTAYENDKNGEDTIVIG